MLLQPLELTFARAQGHIYKSKARPNKNLSQIRFLLAYVPDQAPLHSENACCSMCKEKWA
eukprot:12425620-Karenia_brevis.AAC.1